MDNRRPGHIDLMQFRIRSYDKTRTTDIGSLIVGMELIESVNHNGLMGSAYVVDSLGVMEDFPILGEEKITLTYKDSFDEEMELELFLYSVENVAVGVQGTYLEYKIYFCSIEKFESMKRLVSKSYLGTYSDMANTIFQEYIAENSEMELTTEETDGTQVLVIPKIEPLDAISFIARKAYSFDSDDNTFMFFQNRKGFEFTSISNLVDTAVEDEKVLTYTFTPGIENKEPDNIVPQTFNFHSFELQSKLNTLADIKKGNVKMKACEVDVLNGIYVEHVFDAYAETDIVKKHTSTFTEETFTDEVLPDYYFLKDYNTDYPTGHGRPDAHYKEILQKKIPYKMNLDSLTARVTAYGHNSIFCGSIIYFSYEKPDLVRKETEKVSILKGLYLVESITHKYLVGEPYMMDMVIKKIPDEGNYQVEPNGEVETISV